jgi:hypothetical protein
MTAGSIRVDRGRIDGGLAPVIIVTHREPDRGADPGSRSIAGDRSTPIGRDRRKIESAATFVEDLFGTARSAAGDAQSANGKEAIEIADAAGGLDLHMRRRVLAR